MTDSDASATGGAPGGTNGGADEAVKPVLNRSGMPVVEPSLAKALLWLGLAMIGFQGINAMIKEVTQYMHPFEVVFWRNLFAVCLILPFLIARHGRHALTLQRPKPIILRGVVEFITMACVFTAFSGMPLAEATAIMFTMPIWITVGAGLFLGEDIRMRRWIATLIGFGGMLVIVRPGAGEVTYYAAAAMIAAVLIAVSSLILRKASQTDSPGRIICWMSLVVTPFGFIAAQPYWQGMTLEIAGMLAIAVLFGTLGHYSQTQSYRFGEASQLAPYRYAELIMAAVIGLVLFGEWPSIYTYIGGAIIAGSGVYIAHREHVLEKRSKARASKALTEEKI